jgi:hypothetical protein
MLSWADISEQYDALAADPEARLMGAPPPPPEWEIPRRTARPAITANPAALPLTNHFAQLTDEPAPSRRDSCPTSAGDEPTSTLPVAPPPRPTSSSQTD